MNKHYAIKQIDSGEFFVADSMKWMPEFFSRRYAEKRAAEAKAMQLNHLAGEPMCVAVETIL